jgi:hypothetical protein
LFFYTYDDESDLFYKKLGIYPASELLIQMINYTENWDGQHIDIKNNNFEFFVAIKKLLPKLNNTSLPIILPTTEDDRLLKILNFLDKNISSRLCLHDLSVKFNMSDRSISRFEREVFAAVPAARRRHLRHPLLGRLQHRHGGHQHAGVLHRLPRDARQRVRRVQARPSTTPTAPACAPSAPTAMCPRTGRTR